MNRTDVINYLIKEKVYQSYLELGTQNKDSNFNKVNCKKKYCVDVDGKVDADFHGTTDLYFESNKDCSKDKFDIIFIDALHEHKQTLKDFNNACEILNEGGCIVLHDALPHNKEYTNPEWCGTAYKACLEISGQYEVRTFSEDHGVCVVFPENDLGIPMEKDLNYDFKYLKEELNAVETLAELIPKKVEIDDISPETPEGTLDDRAALEAMTDDSLKARYKELTGAKRAKSREKMIEAILSF